MIDVFEMLYKEIVKTIVIHVVGTQMLIMNCNNISGKGDWQPAFHLAAKQ